MAFFYRPPADSPSGTLTKSGAAFSAAPLFRSAFRDPFQRAPAPSPSRGTFRFEIWETLAVTETTLKNRMGATVLEMLRERLGRGCGRCEVWCARDHVSDLLRNSSKRMSRRISSNIGQLLSSSCGIPAFGSTAKNKSLLPVRA